MKFIVDAHLPIKLKYWLIENGHDALHILDLPKKQSTPDVEIIELAEREKRIVVSKDSDFFKYHLIKGIPEKVLFITTGNIVNKELFRLFELNFKTIENHFNSGKSIIEIDNHSITVHS